MKHVVVLNGPPRCGKDLAALSLYRLRGYEIHRFSDPLKRAIPALFGVRHAKLEPGKDSPDDTLFGASYRELQISLSERWAKPQFGQDVFGRLLLRAIAGSPRSRIVVPDSGFDAELQVLAREAGIRVLLVQVHRPGTSFAGDSRAYVDPPPGVEHAVLHNDGAISTYALRVVSLVRRWEQDCRVDPDVGAG